MVDDASASGAPTNGAGGCANRSLAKRDTRLVSDTGSKSGSVGAPGTRALAPDAPGVDAPAAGSAGVAPAVGSAALARRSSPGVSPEGDAPEGNARWLTPGVSGVLMVVVDLHALEHAQGVVCEHGHGAVQGDQIRGCALLIDAHETHGKARAHLAREPRLK